MNNEFEGPSNYGRTTIDQELHTSRLSVDSGLDRIERLIVRDRIRSPCKHHGAKLHG